MTVERNVKVRIDLAVDNPIAFMDDIQKRTEAVEASHKRLAQMASSGVLGTLMDKEIKLMEANAKKQRDMHLNGMPVMEAKRRLELEEQIWKTRVGRPYDVQYMIRQESLAREQEETRRQAQYKARFGSLGGAVRGADSISASGFGYAAMSAGMLTSVHAAGGGAYDTFAGSVRRASGEIGIMFIPALMKVASIFEDFASFMRNMNPTLKTTIGYLATYGLLLSGGAKVFSMAMGGLSSLTVAFQAAAVRIGASSAATAATTATTTAAGAIGVGGGAAGGATVASGAIGKVAGPIAVLLAVLAEAKRLYDAPNKGAALAESSLRGTGIGGFYFSLRDLITGGRELGDSRPSTPPPPLSIPGFQSQQFDIFSLKDQIQMEALRDPAQQADFNLAVRSFETLLEEWRNWFRDNRMGDMRI